MMNFHSISFFHLHSFLLVTRSMSRMFSEFTEKEVFRMRNCHVQIQKIVPYANSSNEIPNVAVNNDKMNEASVSFDSSLIETYVNDVINVTGNIIRGAPIQRRRKTEEVKGSKPFIIKGRRPTH